MPAFVRRLLRAGRLPDESRSELASEGIVELAESLAVVVRFSGSVPGLHSGASTFRTAGAVAFTSQRVVATLATRARPALLAVDRRWDAPDAGPMSVAISAAGVTLDVDVHRVRHDLRGRLSLHYRHGLSAPAVALVPRTPLRHDVAPEFVFDVLGVRPPGQ